MNDDERVIEVPVVVGWESGTLQVGAFPVLEADVEDETILIGRIAQGLREVADEIDRNGLE